MNDLMSKRAEFEQEGASDNLFQRLTHKMISAKTNDRPNKKSTNFYVDEDHNEDKASEGKKQSIGEAGFKPKGGSFHR